MANSTLLDQIRPYSGYSSIDFIAPIFFSDYNSLQASLTKQFSDGSILNLDYTWSKTLTNNQDGQCHPSAEHL